MMGHACIYASLYGHPINNSTYHVEVGDQTSGILEEAPPLNLDFSTFPHIAAYSCKVGLRKVLDLLFKRCRGREGGK